MGNGKSVITTDECGRYKKILAGNIRKIYSKYAKSMEEFYLEWLNPMRPDQRETQSDKSDMESYRARMNRFVHGTQQPTLEELLRLSDLAGVSINELLTEEIDIDRSYREARDTIYTLFNLLDSLNMEVKEVSIDGKNRFVLYPQIEIPEDFAECSCKEQMKFIMGHFINEFLREYTKHIDQKTTDKKKYDLWRQEVLKGAFAFTIDGQEYENRQPTAEAKVIADNTNASIAKAHNEYWESKGL